MDFFSLETKGVCAIVNEINNVVIDRKKSDKQVIFGNLSSIDFLTIAVKRETQSRWDGQLWTVNLKEIPVLGVHTNSIVEIHVDSKHAYLE